MKLTILIAIIASFNLLAGTKVIYGKDNRTEWFEANPSYRDMANSTAAMVNKERIKFKGNEYSFEKKTLTDFLTGVDQQGVPFTACEDVKYKKQLAVASCSGFLIGEDLLVTAGHCIKNRKDCRDNFWIFDYKLNSKIDTAESGDKSNVFKCKKIIERKPGFFSRRDDYALIKLDRKTNRKPLGINLKELDPQASLVVIGHPSGLPQKIADDAVVKSKRKLYFFSNLDTFGGNSGSAVINVDTGLVEGILVQGAPDYIRRKAGNKCIAVNFLPQNYGQGERVTYIKNIKKLSGASSGWWPW